MAEITKTITENWYDNGGHTITVDGLMTYIKYNSGDEIWLDEAGKVWSIHTHDGLRFTFHYPAWFNLTPRVPKGG